MPRWCLISLFTVKAIRMDSKESFNSQHLSVISLFREKVIAKIRYRNQSTVPVISLIQNGKQTFLLSPHKPVMLYETLLNFPSLYFPRLIRMQLLVISF